MRWSLLAICTGSVAAAQARPLPELHYQPELTIELAKHNIRKPGTMVVSPAGRVVISTEQWIGEIVAFDSTGKKLDWKLTTGRVSDADIGWVTRVAWVGDSLWIEDRLFDQVAIVDANGKIVRSVERPSWIRPSWGDRRKYPLFSAMNWEAFYPNGDMLVVPSRPRAIFDTPLYDRTSQYLVRTNSDGKILKTIAKIPAFDGRMFLRDGSQSHVVSVPLYNRTWWRVSSDGQRVVFVAPAAAAVDNGNLTVTMLNDEGDTVFVRKVPLDARRISPGRADTLVAGYQAFGKYSAQWIKDTVRKLIPAYESLVLNVIIGVDHSTWIWLRSDKPEQNAIVIDSKGNLAGRVTFGPSRKMAAYSVDHLWTVDPVDSRNQQFNIVRSRRVTTTARPARNASVSGSPKPATRPE